MRRVGGETRDLSCFVMQTHNGTTQTPIETYKR
jgi:hypothetical protein